MTCIFPPHTTKLSLPTNETKASDRGPSDIRATLIIYTIDTLITTYLFPNIRDPDDLAQTDCANIVHIEPIDFVSSGVAESRPTPHSRSSCFAMILHKLHDAEGSAGRIPAQLSQVNRHSPIIRRLDLWRRFWAPRWLEFQWSLTCDLARI